MDKLINIREAALMLGVSTKTLRNWDDDGKFVSLKTKGGHRRYLLSEIKLLMRKDNQMICDLTRKYITTDEAVEDLLDDLEEKPDSKVVQTMKRIIKIIEDVEHDMDYGAIVRVLTKVLMIVNEDHRKKNQ